ncbi:hypothetical protein QZH41_006941 [Actinostola sp. cb2023]|nr:hypothetical protein QZH41_006941 [Actinostola sp. cb2023]
MCNLAFADFCLGLYIFILTCFSIKTHRVSSYGKVAVCLPFDVSDVGSAAYVASLLFLNGVSFLSVIYLYARMLVVAVRGGDMEGAPKRNDGKVAKRMAALVFTDMACWAPIAFFGLLAAFGVPLINVTESKVLLVFFFPINSVCNPFLYAFFTRAFKREFFALLSRFGFCKFTALKYNGTLSSVLYSRSRRNQSTSEDRSKRISTVSSPSYDFRRSNVDLVGTDSKSTTEKVDIVQMNGISNLSYTPEGSQTIPAYSARFVKSTSGTDGDEVFFPSSPKLPPGNTSSPKSILKKASVVENPHVACSENDLHADECGKNDDKTDDEAEDCQA